MSHARTELIWISYLNESILDSSICTKYKQKKASVREHVDKGTHLTLYNINHRCTCGKNDHPMTTVSFAAICTKVLLNISPSPCSKVWPKGPAMRMLRETLRVGMMTVSFRWHSVCDSVESIRDQDVRSMLHDERKTCIISATKP